MTCNWHRSHMTHLDYIAYSLADFRTAGILLAFVLVVLIAGYLHIRGHDIRLILFAAAAAMYALKAIQPDSAGHRFDLFGDYFLEFARGLTNPSAVVPICCAMGFAYVCKFTRCDAHLVHLLVSPLR